VDGVSAANGDHQLGAAAKSVAEHASALTKLEIELAQLELKKKAATFSIGLGLGITAGVLAWFGLAFMLAAIAAAIALEVSVWAALLIMTGALFLLAGILGAIAVGRVKKATPPVPEEAIEEAKRTTEAIKS
jgi:uncharacterized membrane protein YqjE